MESMFLSSSSGNFGTGALRINQTCLSLRERCRAATERAGSLVRELDLQQAKTEGVLQIDKIRMRFALTRTCSHVCPLSHLLCKCQLSQRESQEGSRSEGAGLPSCGKTEGVFQISKIRIRFTLKRSCSRAAPSVAACAAFLREEGFILPILLRRRAR